jgi:hypothetical protein
MRRSQLSMLIVFWTRATNEVLQQQQIPRTPLHNRQQPIPQLQLATSRIRLLRPEKLSKRRMIIRIWSMGTRRGDEVSQSRYRFGERCDKGGVEGEIGEVRKQDRGQWRI